MEEIWKDVKDYEGLYQVSSIGRIKSLPRNGTINKERILKCTVDKDGYLKVNLSKNNIQRKIIVHRLVAMAFISNPYNYPQVNHIDGNKQNNEATNLEWVSNKENIQHAYKIGLITHEKITKNLKHYSEIGKKNPKSVQVVQYDLNGNFIKEWGSVNQIQKELGYHSQNICCCCQGKYKKAFGYIWKNKEVTR